MWIYNQSSGELLQDGLCVATGYSGFGSGKNNPSAQALPNIGPIPVGRYIIGPALQTKLFGPLVMRLTPCAGTQTFGRSGFLIHGDSIKQPGTASHGCIILPRTARLLVSKSHSKQLRVIKEASAM